MASIFAVLALWLYRLIWLDIIWQTADTTTLSSHTSEAICQNIIFLSSAFALWYCYLASHSPTCVKDLYFITAVTWPYKSICAKLSFFKKHIFHKKQRRENRAVYHLDQMDFSSVGYNVKNSLVSCYGRTAVLPLLQFLQEKHCWLSYIKVTKTFTKKGICRHSDI